jgi:hypothetical protein
MYGIELTIKMRKNKKGMVYTMIAILLLSTLIYTTKFHRFELKSETRDDIDTRVFVLNSFITNLKEDLKRGIYISGYRAIFNEINFIVEQRGDFINDSQKTMVELFLNGTIDGINNGTQWMINNTFYDWKQRIESEADSYEINLTIILNDVEVRQESPWSITFSTNTTLIIKDKRDIAQWSIDQITDVDISIEDLEDPVYSLNTLGRVFKFVKPANNTDFVDDQNQTHVLMNHTIKTYYINTNVSPSFLQRLEGNYSADPQGNGIESLVYPFELDAVADYDSVTMNKSLNDYVFFNPDINNNSGCCSNITEEWFKVSPQTIKVYELENFSIC